MATITQTAPTVAPAAPSALATIELQGYDEEQIRLMEERCILVDTDDQPYGDGSKKACHLMANINKGLLHRAFSVFLFRPSDGRLLLQKRADEKITFPSMWTNTCCSHPLSIRSEVIDEDALGAKNAAKRKLTHELGIPQEQIRIQDFTFLTRIHYLAPSDGIWGEHEIDYILFCSLDVDTELNLNEVSDAKYVSRAELEEMFKDESNSFTPWFMLIARNLLFPWWDEMFAKSQAKGWDAAKGVGAVDASVLAGGDKVGEIIRMV